VLLTPGRVGSACTGNLCAHRATVIEDGTHLVIIAVTPLECRLQDGGLACDLRPHVRPAHRLSYACDMTLATWLRTMEPANV
jgi:hypothetical protein